MWLKYLKTPSMSHFIPNQVIIVDDWEPKFKIKIKAKEINK